MDKIAVVILNWNGCEMLRSFLPSVVRFSEADGAVVYVADNGSTDASVEMLCREFPTVRLILLEENQGFADGYNMALQEVDAEYVVLLNSDVEVTGHWLIIWGHILRQQLASRRYGVGGRRRSLSMQVRQAAFSIITAIRSVVGGLWAW
jgi:GT2 family glycosyltransferase